MNDAGRIFGLDALRAAAILSVLSAHCFGVLYPHVPYLGLLGHGGFYGVELFFVLSGYLIGQILLRHGIALSQRQNLVEFYVRRWFRTLPLFGLFFAINLWLEANLRHHRLTLPEILGQAFFLRTFAGNHAVFFLESWSLAIEEWFYLLFPLMLWVGFKYSKRVDGVFWVMATAFYLYSTAGRMLSGDHPPDSWAWWQREVVICRFDALMTGVLAAWMGLRFPRAWSRWANGCASGGVILLIAMYATLWSIHGRNFSNAPDTFFARTFRFNLVSLGFGLLLPMASQWTLRKESWASMSTRKIALWSYAIYLAQSPVVQLVDRHFFSDWSTSIWQGFGSFFVKIAATIAVSALLFYLYESPLTRLRERAAPAIARIAGEA
jgi:peptidoglycan/LPS O-acetylase OafA/YrhL